MRPANCVWCGRPLGDDASRLPGRTVCPACGVATTDPWPSEAELDRAYSTWYRPDSGRFSGIGDRLLRRTRGRLARRIDRLAPAGPVLDVGAGDGALLDALAARGREAVGLERASQREGIREGEVTGVEGRFAAVVFWHSLEHLPNPGEAIDRGAELLLPGGLLLVAVPNAASLQARAFGDRWFALDIPRHLVHLGAASLTTRLTDGGLRIGRVSHWRGGQVLFGWLHGLVGLLPGRPSLYDAIRRPQARERPLSGPKRVLTFAAASLLFAPAALAAAAEVAARRGGSVYVEARRG